MMPTTYCSMSHCPVELIMCLCCFAFLECHTIVSSKMFSPVEVNVVCKWFVILGDLSEQQWSEESCGSEVLSRSAALLLCFTTREDRPQAAPCKLAAGEHSAGHCRDHRTRIQQEKQTLLQVSLFIYTYIYIYVFGRSFCLKWLAFPGNQTPDLGTVSIMLCCLSYRNTHITFNVRFLYYISNVFRWQGSWSFCAFLFSLLIVVLGWRTTSSTV